HRLLLPLQRGLADAGQARVGVQADKQVVAQAGVGQERLEARDLHGRGATQAACGGARATPQAAGSATTVWNGGGEGQEQGRGRARAAPRLYRERPWLRPA